MVQDAGLGRRFHAPPAPEGPGWRSATDLFGAGLDDAVQAHAASRRTTDLRAAASLLVSGFANQVTGPALAELLLHRRAVTPTLADLAVHRADGRIDDVAIPDAARSAADRDGAGNVRAALLDGVFEPVVSAVRAAFRVSPAVLWGNVAASFSSAARVLSWKHPDGGPRDRCLDDVHHLLDGDRRTAGRTHHFRVEAGGLAWHGFERGTCCLAYRTGPGTYCASCCLLDGSERRTRLLSAIEKQQDGVRA